MIILDKYVDTLIKLINVSNMTEVWGTLKGVNGHDIILYKSIIVMNRAVADLATTLDNIIQYKYDGNTIGSSIATPLGPVFSNSDEGSIVNINVTDWVVVPFYESGIDLNSAELLETDDGFQLSNLINSMNRYIDDIYIDYTEMGKYFLPSKNDKNLTPNEESNE